MDNYELFKKCMAGFGELFEKEISKTLLSIYWDCLENFSDEQCENAFKEVLVTCRFFPKPVEIIEIIESKIKCKTPIWL